MSALFIAGTDTGAGKTLVTGLLGDYLIRKGRSVVTQKWVQTGGGRDIETHMALMGRKKSHYRQYSPFILPYSFKFASSPYLAARLEHKRVSAGVIRKSLKILSSSFDHVLVEGTGGLMVPLNEKKLFIDLVKELRLPVLLVAANRLGAINHTLLSIEAIRTRRMRFIGTVFNNIAVSEVAMVLNDNVKTVGMKRNNKVIGVMPREDDPGRMREIFRPIADKIYDRL